MRNIAIVAGNALLVATLPPATAQQPIAQPTISPDQITGRSFAGMTVAAGVQEGDITIRASKGWAWSEANLNPPPGTAAETSRLYLLGDVRLDIGRYHFDASRAVVWVEQAGVSDEDPSIPVYQIAVYFDRVDDPAAEAGIAQHGDRLMVTGMLAGKLNMKADILQRGRPPHADPAEDLVHEGEARLAKLQREVLGRGAGGSEPAEEPVRRTVPGPQAMPDTGPIRPGISRPYEPESPLARGESAVPVESELPPSERMPAIFSQKGTITFAGGDPVLLTAAEEDALVITGGVTVQYTDPRQGQNLIVNAERCVAFFDKGAIADLFRASAGKVHGIYLEGDVVATNGAYTMRAPRIFYDVAHNSAVAVDAVFWTYDERTASPLYVRARAMRQEAENRWSASGAELTNSTFVDPTFAIGASALTITRTEVPGEPTRTTVEADHVYGRVGPLPFFYYPRFSGDMGENFPLQRIVFGASSDDGFTVKTAWDVFGLLGMEPPPGLKAKLLVDGYTERGAGLGGDISWNSEKAGGRLFTYGIIEDNGTDRLPSGAEIEHENDTRGMVLGDHRWTIDENWTLFLEGSYVGDPTFVPEFFRGMAETGREFTNAGYLRRLEGNTALTFLGKGEFMDFTPNEYLQQSSGYNTDKLPEVTYTRLADDVLGGVAPGLLSYSSEYRFSRMRLNFTEPTAREMGFDTLTRSQEAFGILPDQSIADRLRARGFTEADVTRFDTRQELSVTADFGPVKVMPFVTGRFTVYDHEFTEYSPDADETTRVWGAAGVRSSTSFTTINDSVDSATFDLHRIRHIVEPSLTVWSAGANLDQNDLPVYDDSVESIATGTAARVGIAQTWQTQRGGEGRWRSVDFLKVNVDATFASNDADQESPIGRFFDYRPEYSFLGDFATASAVWQATDALAITALETFDLELNQSAYTVLGGKFDHSTDFSTYLEMRYINARDITIVGGGAEYQLTRAYWIGTYLAYDTNRGDIQTISATIHRRFTAATLGVRVSYDKIADDFSFAIELQPMGARSRGDILTRLQRDTY